MNAFEKGLSRSIPLEKAASFFVGLKRHNQLVAPADDALMAEHVKVAAVAHFTAKELEEMSSALHAQGADVDEKPGKYRAIRGAIGGTLGGSLGYLAGSAVGRPGLGAALGAAGGTALGAVPKPSGDRARKDAAQITAMPAKTASQSWEELVASVKTAGDDGMPASSDALPPPQKGKPELTDAYVEQELAAQGVEDQGSISFYQQKLQELREQSAMAEQRAQGAEQQVVELQSQQEQHDGQVAAATQEGQIAQQAAMQQVQSANTAASTAMGQAVDAENRALTAKGQEASAKIQSQQVRSQLFDLASQGLPGTEPELGGDPAAGGTGDPTEGVEPLEAGAQPGAEAGDPAAGGVEGQPGVAEGEPGSEGAEAPNAGMNEAGQPASAEGMPGQEGAPTEAAGAAAGPGAAPPGGGGPGSPPQANGAGEDSAPEQDPSMKRQGQVSIKVGARAARVPMTAEKIAASLPSYLRDPKIIGALAGGAMGTGAAALEASGDGSHLDKLRGRISENEESSKEPGLAGFAKTFDLVKDKAMLTLGEATQRHPVAATITGGLLGAGAGYEAGPQLHKLVNEAASLHKG